MIAPMHSHAISSASNPDLHHRIYTHIVAVHLQQSAGEEPQLLRRHESATAFINSDQRELASAISTALRSLFVLRQLTEATPR